MEVPNKMYKVQRKEEEFYESGTDLTEKIRLKSRTIPLWGASLTSGKMEKICTFNFWWT